MPILHPDPDLSRLALQKRTGVSDAALDIYLRSSVIDLHIESFSFYRSFGYDPTRRHGPGINRALLFNQADLPRLSEAKVAGATWVITANPLRPEADRNAAFLSQLNELTALLEGAHVFTKVVGNYDDFLSARALGAHAAFVGVQGANALSDDPYFLEQIKDRILRITLLHMSDSRWGSSSTPQLRFRHPGLSNQGSQWVEAMNHCKIGVDLAHIHPQGFWDAIRAHDPHIPVLVSHTAMRGVFDHWRNLSDLQLKAIAKSGGMVGIMYHSMYTGDPLLGGRVSTIARHIKHAVSVVGEDFVGLGSDWDGLICTPRDMPTCSELPRLVDALLTLKVSEEAVVKILGANFLRVLKQLRTPK